MYLDYRILGPALGSGVCLSTVLCSGPRSRKPGMTLNVDPAGGWWTRHSNSGCLVRGWETLIFAESISHLEGGRPRLSCGHSKTPFGIITFLCLSHTPARPLTDPKKPYYLKLPSPACPILCGLSNPKRRRLFLLLQSLCSDSCENLGFFP